MGAVQRFIMLGVGSVAIFSFLKGMDSALYSFDEA